MSFKQLQFIVSLLLLRYLLAEGIFVQAFLHAQMTQTQVGIWEMLGVVFPFWIKALILSTLFN